MSAIEVVEPGALTTVQDAVGRPGWQHLGVPVGGAADPWSARLANRLVDNAPAAAVLEITVHGPSLRFDDRTAVALVGALDATLDGMPVPAGVARDVRAGDLLRIGAGTDARAWLAIAGGILVPPVLGSRATDLRTRFGGLDGRALRAGDRLELGPATGRRFRWLGSEPGGPVRVLPGPDLEDDLLAALIGATWRVGAEADRTGVRLDGPALGGSAREVPSMGLSAGAIQLPPDGRPIVMLADRPVTGGYPVPAIVIGADVGRMARLGPGREVRFAPVSMGEAVEARRASEASLEALEALAAPLDESDAGWAGSHA